ncbi:hypothetical protein, partial [Paenarthrobacter ureafaciens]|uniref:hypothetical protein n=1 Tax=Paenarthrobacter ureafaciens TaxID=37931 RepID=UPI001D17C9D2
LSSTTRTQFPTNREEPAMELANGQPNEHREMELPQLNSTAAVINTVMVAAASAQTGTTKLQACQVHGKTQVP